MKITNCLAIEQNTHKNFPSSLIIIAPSRGFVCFREKHTTPQKVSNYHIMFALIIISIIIIMIMSSKAILAAATTVAILPQKRIKREREREK